MIQEDEVDGVDPIIRVWNLDKVQIAVFFFDACNMLLKSLQEKLCHVNQTCNTCTQITCFNPCLGFIVGLSWIKGWGLVMSVGGGGGGGGGGGFFDCDPPPPPPSYFHRNIHSNLIPRLQLYLFIYPASGNLRNSSVS